VNRAVESAVWVATLLCLGVAVMLYVRDSGSQAAVMGCVALVFAIIGVSGRRQPRRPPADS
jgi:hypothetical protein